jgi:hypothetical protein
MIRIHGIWLFQMPVYLPYPSDHQQNADQVKAKINKKNVWGKMLYFFNFRHHLRNPKKDADSGQQKQNAPDQLEPVFLTRHIVVPYR